MADVLKAKIKVKEGWKGHHSPDNEFFISTSTYSILSSKVVCTLKVPFLESHSVLEFFKVGINAYLSNSNKAKLLQVGIIFLIHLFAWEILLIKKLEIKEIKTI